MKIIAFVVIGSVVVSAVVLMVCNLLVGVSDPFVEDSNTIKELEEVDFENHHEHI